MSDTENVPTTDAAAVADRAVVVAVDGSPTADRALAWASGYAELGNRRLVVAHGLDLFRTAEAAGFSVSPAWSALVHDELIAAGEAIVAEAAAKVAETHPALAVATVVEQRDPRQVLLGLSERAELIVMGSRGRGAIRRLLLGSVAAAVAGRAACPVVVVPATDDGDES